MPDELFPSMAGMVFLKSNGASFSSAIYPKLALAYPGLKLADLRGEFIRGWDDGRGVDLSRAILSAQDSTYLRTGAMDFLGRENEGTTVGIGIPYSNADSVTRSLVPPSGSFRAPNNTNIDGSTQRDNGVNGTSMNNAYGSDGNVWISARPRNVAFNYIVRAA